MENGAPYFQILTTLAHEWVYIWQYEHLHQQYMAREDEYGRGYRMLIRIMNDRGLEEPFGHFLTEFGRSMV
jgi:hypothetical protein